jgi:peptide/nickel transport system substrate-binding protein
MSGRPRSPRSVTAALAALAAVAGTLLLGSCTGPAARDELVLRTATSADPPGLNPLVFDNANVSFFAPLFHGYLLRTDGNGKLIPDLALVVPTVANGGIAPDGRSVTYHLRHGVRWQDGVGFDARDVVFSFRAAMNPANQVPDRTGFDHVADIRALDPYTVRVRLTEPFTPFVPSCFTLAANDPYALLPAHLLAGKSDLNRDPYNAHPIGLGPYMVAAWDRGNRIVLKADPHYFRGTPAIPRIDITIVPNINTTQTLWQSGKLDVLFARVQGGRRYLEALRAVPGTHTVLRPHYEFDFVIFNLTHPPLDDVRVRRAIIEGVDRKRIMRNLEGELHLPGDTDRLPGQFAYDPSIVQPDFDPAGAARLLDAAGWRLIGGVRTKNGRQLSFDYVGTTETPLTGSFGLLLAQDLTKLGIRMSIKSYGYNLIFASAAQHGIYQAGRFDLTLSGWQPDGVNDHSYLFRCDTRPPNGDNFGRICDAAIDTAARAELGTSDPAREAKADRALTRRLVAQSDLLFVGFNEEAAVYRDGLEGIVPSVTGQHLWNAWAWRWNRSPKKENP